MSLVLVTDSYDLAAERLVAGMASHQVTVENFGSSLRDLCHDTSLSESKVCRIARRQLDRGEYADRLVESIDQGTAIYLRLHALAA